MAQIACNLKASDMAGRLADWHSVLAHATSRIRHDDGSLRLTFDGVPAVELTRLAAAEHACCAFFAFAVTIDDRGLGLEVTAPAAADEIVTALFGEPA